MSPPPDPPGRSQLREWLRAMRLHQWGKNLLVLAPLLLAGGFMAPAPLLRQFAGVAAVGLAASGSYIINDILDRDADRAHATKRERPFAAGRLQPWAGLGVALALICGGLAAAFALSPAAALWLLAYLALTLAYSLRLKALAVVDVAALAVLYTLRLSMGASLAGVPLSAWLLLFSVVFFFSLSTAKRHSEIVKATAAGLTQRIRGRGYHIGDAPLTLALGVSATSTAFLLLVLFLVFQAFHQANYVRPQLLWAAPFAVFLWSARIWLFAARGELDDDPVVFALKDRASHGLGLLLAASVLAAVRIFP